jgi:hypothetical protein
LIIFEKAKIPDLLDIQIGNSFLMTTSRSHLCAT